MDCYAARNGVVSYSRITACKQKLLNINVYTTRSIGNPINKNQKNHALRLGKNKDKQRP